MSLYKKWPEKRFSTSCGKGAAHAASGIRSTHCIGSRIPCIFANHRRIDWRRPVDVEQPTAWRLVSRDRRLRCGKFLCASQTSPPMVLGERLARDGNFGVADYAVDRGGNHYAADSAGLHRNFV